MESMHLQLEADRKAVAEERSRSENEVHRIEMDWK